MNSSTSNSPEPPAAGGIRSGSYYGHGIPYLPIEGHPGKIIAIEGTDGVGRSTQIRLLREWLEVQGYGVIETGWTRSELMQPTIELAKASNTLNKLTFVLLYATDFADRLEKEIIPALKAGFIVLSDRYIFTAMARAGVRGVDRTWMRNLYGFGIAPHLVFYLKIDEKTLIRRVLQSRGHGLLGIRDGHEARRRHLRELPRPISGRCCASTRRWRTNSDSASSMRAGRSRSSRTSCAARSARFSRSRSPPRSGPTSLRSADPDR